MTENSGDKLGKDVWRDLRRYTSARIAQGRSGVSMPTMANLQFQLDHARARDAVHLALNIPKFISQYRHVFPDMTAPIVLQSEAADRGQYLQRPDLGRRLPESLWQDLRHLQNDSVDIAIVVADGLSSAAVQAHAMPFLRLLIPSLNAQSLSLAPLSLASQARVALGDDIGEALKAKLVIMLIGERPGLSSPDSLGVYISYGPYRGCSDANRNCISNIRAGGLSYQQACDTALYLIVRALDMGLTGVNLKDQSALVECESGQKIPFFAK
ncbi:Ethanolamine ammonia-lyase light chain [Zhongshania aliphaticivorans]|uniref:Ethanolamine ammonia-lyase small subunit n=1 Tax=Zhongshania aliphaticivorans TaxID=1470434 RepID=A0A5S9PMZ9_9GAMM|nr:ethanolamine ammonia-lyase subunit EutC [Zhongshania aliphaticivorans]CAA0105150.1 Ethanolamine ammonia-lyase light chain [Zhongshania aliphaticivorans]CAA0105432.1 Ethanolamine ammonia-lyase light chain [Zhongshania aliphaticivorans]